MSSRPVFISENQRDAIELILAHVSAEDYSVQHNELQQVQDAWDAAPADAVEAAQDALEEHGCYFAVNAVLRALGMPA